MEKLIPVEFVDGKPTADSLQLVFIQADNILDHFRTDDGVIGREAFFEFLKLNEEQRRAWMVYSLSTDLMRYQEVADYQVRVSCDRAEYQKQPRIHYSSEQLNYLIEVYWGRILGVTDNVIVDSYEMKLAGTDGTIIGELRRVLTSVANTSSEATEFGLGELLFGSIPKVELIGVYGNVYTYRSRLDNTMAEVMELTRCQVDKDNLVVLLAVRHL